MAYMTEIQTACNTSGCTRRATHEVRNTYNSAIGQFCRQCATQRVKELTAAEKRTIEISKRIDTEGV